MKGAANIDQCCNRYDAIAYLYDEMPADDRERFEMHLPGCSDCIEEFAWLSQNRYSVYEWKQIDFDPLPTPSITIPFADAAGAGWFARLRSAFSMQPSLSFAGGIAVLVFAAIVGVAYLSLPNGDIQMADVVVQQSPQATPDHVLPEISASGELTAEPGPVKQKERTEPDALRAEPTAGTKAQRVRPNPVPKRTPERKDAMTAVNPRELPSLLQAEETEDESLRLSDIFEEIGTIE